MLPPPLPVVDRINKRFHAAVRGSSDLMEIGVMIHGLDGTEDPKRKWAPCPIDVEQCGFLSDRMSASVVHPEKVQAFSIEGGGVVLNPKYVTVLCAFGGDGGTRGRTCSPPGKNPNCVPGCWAGPACWNEEGNDRKGKGGCWQGAGQWSDWCDPFSGMPAMSDGWCGGRAWQPEDLGELLSRDRARDVYNEIIVDAQAWNEHLPDSIEAVLTDGQGGAGAQWYTDFLSSYPESRAPLLLYVPGPENPGGPFVQIS